MESFRHRGLILLLLVGMAETVLFGSSLSSAVVGVPGDEEEESYSLMFMVTTPVAFKLFKHKNYTLSQSGTLVGLSKAFGF